MCILIYKFLKRKDSRLVISFNRDELYNRKWEDPDFHWNNGVFGCKDIVESGSWFVINNYGIIACIINIDINANRIKSRGNIPLLINDCKSIKYAIAKIKKQILPNDFMGFKLYLFDQNKIVQISNVQNDTIANSINIEYIHAPFGIISKYGINSNRINRGYDVFPSYIENSKISISNVLSTIKQKLTNEKSGMILKDVEWGTTSSILLNYENSNSIIWNYSSNLKSFKYYKIAING